MLRKFTLALLSLLLVPLAMMAQNVTISPQNGSMICAGVSGQGTSGGAFAMWKHEQLALTMIASGATDLTDDGILRNHRNWFNTCNGCTFRSNVTAAQKATYIDCGWQDANGYYTISLPKGYRFTSYRFELSHDITNTGQGFETTTNTQVSFAETNSTFGTNIESVTLPAVPNSANAVQVFVLTRTGDDMGNVLYFKATGPTGYNTRYYDITFRHVELTFAADADTPIDILPNAQVSTGHSLLEVPFNTGKVDIGEVTQRNTGSGYRISYSLNNFKDMSANMLLYEYGSTKQGTGFDGTSGLVAYDKAGSITTEGNYFRFTPSTDVEEQKYVLETPVSAIQAGNIENPVQFRITGAAIRYTNVAEETFHITCVIDGTTYYLGTNGRFTTDQQTVWMKDAAGHIHSGSSYLQGTNGDVSTGPLSGATVYSITNNGAIRYGNTNRYLKAHANYTWSWGDYVLSHYSGRITNSSDDTMAEIDEISAGGTSNATIYVYDKEGNRDSRYPNGITINSTDKVSISDLNNDAIIFGVKGGDEALLNFEVDLQALNPYIDQMTVVLNVKKDDNTNVRMTRSFTSDDFSVGGDTFEFYLPTELAGKAVDMTFEDLYSKYGDETYDHISGTEHSSSRYNFVMSQHHQAYTSDNIYNNTAEAKSSTLESVRLAANNGEGEMVRTKVGTVGDQPFVFNNVDELSANAGYVREFPFTVSNYQNQSSNQYLRVKPENGEFIAAHFTEDEVHDSGHTKNFYVFTTDETRYNIAPTTATQHRAYAFYEMVVLVQVGTYDPIATFEPIYTNAFYEDENGKNTTGDFYGVKITAPSHVTTPLASDVAMNKAIVNKIKENNPSATADDIAAEMKKILYLDASALSGVYHTSPMSDADASYAVENFNALKAKFAKNALVFLPANATARFDNFAYIKKGEVLSFQSANNIVLTDKHPFYSPYDIQVDAANYARYTRQITKSTYSGEAYATVIMPFEISLVDGQHVDEYGTLEFLQMNSNNAFSDSYYNYGPTAFFTKTKASKVEANTPYALHVVENKGTDGAFTVNQKGSNIIATPEAAKSGNTLFSATKLESTGNLTDKNNNKSKYTFSHKGSFSGYKIPRENPKTFYFANNGFYSSVELKSYYTTVDLYPFRSVYEVTKIEGGGNAKVGFLHFFEGENDNETDGINALNGSVKVDVNAPVYDMQGRMIAPTYREAKSLQSGMYVVNGVKIIVK